MSYSAESSARQQRSESAEHSSSSAQGRPSKRKRQNVSRACTTCRRKRTRCDGQPRCATCKMVNEECIYEGDSDGRKPASKQYVESLKNRIKQLEKQIDTSQSELDTMPRQTSSQRRQESTSPVTTTSGMLPTVREGPAASAENRLRSNTGAMKYSHDHVAHYGPSSAYMHLPDEPFSDQEDPEGESRAKVTLVDMPWDLVNWSRHLPPDVSLDCETHKRLLSFFLSYMNDWCCWLDESAFLMGLQSSAHSDQAGGLRTAHYSPFYHNIVLAISLLLAHECMPPQERAHNTARQFIQHATSMIDTEMRRPLSTTARGLMLLGTFHFHDRQRNLGWLYEGMGARTAQILGLNTDCEGLVNKGYMSARAKEHRDRVFYTIYIQDILWSFNVGRTAAIHYDDFDTKLPAIDSDEDSEPWLTHDERLQPNRNVGGRRPGWKSTCFHSLARLVFIADRIHQCLYRIRMATVDQERSIVTKLDLDLHTWLAELPVPLRLTSWPDGTHPPWIINLHAVYHYFRILLHRPIYMRRTSAQDDQISLSEQACQASATEIWRAFNLYDAAGCLKYSTMTLCNIAFTSGTMFLLEAVQNDTAQHRVSQAVQRVKDHIAFLFKMPWPAARVAQGILQKLKDDWTIPEVLSEPSSGSSDTLEALQNPDSDLVKLLKSMGWAPPTAGTPLPAAPASGSSLSPVTTINMNDLHTQQTLPMMPNFAMPFANTAGQGTLMPPPFPSMTPMSDPLANLFASFDPDHVTDVQSDLFALWPFGWRDGDGNPGQGGPGV